MSHSSGDSPLAIAGEVYTTLDQTGVVTTSGEVEQAPFGIVMFSDEATRAGIACYFPFIGGIEHEVVVLVRSAEIDAQLRGVFSVEAHGFLGRFQNAKTDLTFPELAITDLAEIVTRVEVEGDVTRVVCRFTPVTSIPSWVYLWWSGAEPLAVQSCSISQVSTDEVGTTLDFTAVILDDQTCFALDTLLPLHDTLTVRFGVAHPSKQVSRVDLLTVRPSLAAVHHGSVSNWRAQAAEATSTYAEQLGMTQSAIVHSSDGPVGSAGLLATGRVDWAWNGHTITAVFEDTVSVRDLTLADAENIVQCSLVVTWSDETTTLVDLRHDNIEKFMTTVRPLRRQWFTAQAERGGRVLEIGGRGSNAAFHRSVLATCDYVSMDIVAGPNVDFVGDAHDLLATFEPESFDAVLADQVFEHLHAPWKAAIEINRILKVGGSVYICAPSAFPLHAEPWDFFRFSDHSWHSLFNASTGFEIEQTELAQPMLITPRVAASPFIMVNTGRSYMMSSVVATKISEPTVTWEAAPVTDSQVWYPESGIAELRNRM